MTDWPLLPLKLVGLWLALTVMSSLGTALAYPLFRRLLRGLRPEARSLGRVAWGALAPVGAAFVVVLTLQPHWAAFLVPNHCHGDHCGAHAPVFSAGEPFTLGLATVSGLVLLALLVALAWALRCGHRRLGALRRLSRPLDGAAYRLVDSPGLLAWCVGVLRPEVVLSRGLVERLGPERLRAVVAHERAHAERLDNLRALLLAWCTIAWPPGRRARIRADLGLDNELCCDRAAADHLGDPALVVAALEDLARTTSSGPVPRRGLAFGSGDLAGRLGHLATDGLGSRGRLRDGLVLVAALSVAWGMLVMLLTALAHLAIEWIGTVGL